MITSQQRERERERERDEKKGKEEDPQSFKTSHRKDSHKKQLFLLVFENNPVRVGRVVVVMKEDLPSRHD